MTHVGSTFRADNRQNRTNPLESFLEILSGPQKPRRRLAQLKELVSDGDGVESSSIQVTAILRFVQWSLSDGLRDVENHSKFISKST